MEATKKINIRGVFFDSVSMAEARSVAESWLLEKSGTARVVHTPNSEIVQMCLEEQKLDLINSADLILPDGAGVLLAAKILGTPFLSGKVAGVDFGSEMAALCAEKGFRLYLYGGKPGVAEKAGEKLAARYPGLQVCGTHDGYSDKEEVASLVKCANTDVLFVCLGAPAQEAFMQQYKESCGARLLCGLGGSVDVYAGTARRAPKIMVALWLEWLYRLVRQPSRIGRMKNIPRFLRGVLREKKERKRGTKQC